MNIKLESVYIQNFMSFAQAEFDFSNDGFTLVSGNNLCPTDLTNSNGSGKSSLFESIFWCLTGETIRGTKNVVNYKFDNCSVEVHLWIDSQAVIIIRSKGQKSDLKLYINGENKSGKGIRDTEKILTDYFPDLTPLLLGSVIVFGQGLPNRFSANTPSGRKEVLEKLTNSDFMIADIKLRVNNRKDLLQKNLQSINDKIIKLTSQKQVYQTQLTEFQEEKSKLYEFNFDTSIESLMTVKQQKENQLKDINVSQINSEICELQKDYTNLITCHNDDLTLCEQEFDSQIRPYRDELSYKEIQLKQLKDQVNNLIDNYGVCPECGNEIEEFDTILIEKNSQVDEIVTTIKELQEKLDVLNYNKELRLGALISNYNVTKQKMLNDINLSQRKLEDTQSIINSLSKEISKLSQDISQLQFQKTTYKQQQDNLTDKITSLSDKLLKIEKEILYNNSEREKISTRLDFVEKVLSLISRELRGVLLEQIINYLSTITNEYAKIVFGSQCIDIMINGNNIGIYLNNKEYEQLSSGERQKIDIILQFSIRNLLSNYYDFSCNTIILDEIFDSLDSSGCTKIIELLNYSLTDISNIFIISHRKDLQIPFDRKFEVLKNIDGNSILNVVQ